MWVPYPKCTRYEWAASRLCGSKLQESRMERCTGPSFCQRCSISHEILQYSTDSPFSVVDWFKDVEPLDASFLEASPDPPWYRIHRSELPTLHSLTSITRIFTPRFLILLITRSTCGQLFPNSPTAMHGYLNSCKLDHSQWNRDL